MRGSWLVAARHPDSRYRFRLERGTTIRPLNTPDDRTDSKAVAYRRLMAASPST
jgi:hypothetical protein